MKATGEAFVTPLTLPVLNVFANTTFSVTNNSVKLVIGDAKVIAFGIGIGVIFGCQAFAATARAFPLE